MIIQCLNCKVKYNIDDNKIKPPGKKVKCSKCGETFFVEKMSSPDDAALISSSNLDPQIEQEKAFNVSTNEDYFYDSSSKFHADNEIDGGFDFDDSETEEMQNKVVEQEEAKNEEVEHPDEENKIDISDNFETSGFEEENQPIEDNFDSVSIEADLNTQTEDKEHEKVDAIDWENPEIFQLEGNSDLSRIDEIAESDYEITEDELEVDSSKTYIKEQIKVKEDENPFRSYLSPDLSVSSSDYNIVSSKANSSPEIEETSMNTINSGNIYQSRKKKGKSFFSKLLTNFLYLIVLIILFTTAFFSLITFGVIPKDQYKKYFSIVAKYIPTPESKAEKKLKNLSVENLKGKWVNTKNGFLFVVYGEVVNNNITPVSYIKLKSLYYSADENLYEQEFYSGNTLSLNDLKNKSAAELREKLSRKSGDVDFDDVNTFAGKNYDIKPGQSVFFYTFYLSKRKILGLKYDIEVLGFESNNI